MTDVQALTQDLRSPNVEVQRSAARELLKQEDCQAAAVDLVRVMGSGDESLVESANGILESIESVSAEQAAALSALLADPALPVVYWAATLLGRSATVAVPYVSDLLGALERLQQGSEQEKIVWALGKLGPAATKAVPHLESLLKKENSPRLTRLTQQALEQIAG
jgi:hypothetical protein